MMGKKKRSINKSKFGNYGRSSTYRKEEEPNSTFDSIDLRELCVENGILMEQQSILKKRQQHGR